MEKEYIEIEKTLVPYSFEVELAAEIFELTVNYNSLGDYFTVDLNKDGAALVMGEKIVYGEPLFKEIYDARFPAPSIIALDESGKETRVGWDNLNETVFLVIDNE